MGRWLWVLVVLGVCGLVPIRSFGQDADPSSEPVAVSADELVVDEVLNIVIARGNVEVSQAGRLLTADTVTYTMNSSLDAADPDNFIAPGETLTIEFILQYTGADDGGAQIDVLALLDERIDDIDLLSAIERRAHEMLLRTGNDLQVVARRFDRDHVVRVEHDRPGAGTEHQARRGP